MVLVRLGQGLEGPLERRERRKGGQLPVEAYDRFLVLNGVLQNEGTDATLRAGWICLQSEGSPIEFRNIYIVPAE